MDTLMSPLNYILQYLIYDSSSDIHMNTTFNNKNIDGLTPRGNSTVDKYHPVLSLQSLLSVDGPLTFMHH